MDMFLIGLLFTAVIAWERCGRKWLADIDLVPAGLKLVLLLLCALHANDGVLLAGLAAKAKNPKDYEVVGGFFSKEPYSCMVPENDSKWRDFVNHTLMELIDSGRFFVLYDKWLGEHGVIPYPMSDKVRNYMVMQSMPE